MNSLKLPSVVCGNKNDCINKVSVDDKIKLNEKWSKYFEISSKNNYNMYEPLIYLARILTKHEDLEFDCIMI